MLPKTVRLIIDVGKIWAYLFTRIALQTVLAAVESVLAVAGAIWDCVNMIGAIKEYHNAKKESVENNQVIRLFDNVVKNHFYYQQCEALAEVSSTYRAIDSQRKILKDVLSSNNNTLKPLDQNTTKHLMGAFLDDLCVDDVNLCLNTFNDRDLSEIKDGDDLKKFREETYYRSTRSPISSISIANSKADLEMLIAMGNL